MEQRSGRREDATRLALKIKEEPGAQKFRQPLKAEKGKEIDSLLESPEGTQALPTP